MNPNFEAVKAYVLKHRFWFELGLYVLVAAGTALWVGRDAYAQAAVLRTEGMRLESMRRATDRWLGSLQPATSAETQEWQQTLAALNQLGAGSDSRLTLVEVITRRAERAGLTNIRTQITSADSVVSVPRAGAKPVNFKVAEYAIIVDFRGNLGSTRAFLANLPPAVSVQALSMGKSGPTMGTHVVLTVYEAVADAPI